MTDLTKTKPKLKRGRPKKKGSLRNRSVHITLTKEEKILLDILAQAAKLDRTAYIRSKIFII